MKSTFFIFVYLFLQDQKFLHSFEDNSDYVYDVQWSPIHPALFASVDGDGRLDLWNLNNETEVTYIPLSLSLSVWVLLLLYTPSGHDK